jgi:transposase
MTTDSVLACYISDGSFGDVCHGEEAVGRCNEEALAGWPDAVSGQHGFGTKLWTLKRVGTLIKRVYGVGYGQTQVWRILGTLGFSAQKPERRAIERDEEAVRHWKRHLARAQKKPDAKAG